MKIPATPLPDSDFLDPRGTDWRLVDQDEARAHAIHIRRVLDNALGFAPDIVAQICRETAELISNPNMYIAAFRWLNAKDRAKFKEYLRMLPP